MTARPRDICRWTQEDDTSDTWSSACGGLWLFPIGSPRQSGLVFCPRCGGHVVLKPYSSEEEEHGAH